MTPSDLSSVTRSKREGVTMDEEKTVKKENEDEAKNVHQRDPPPEGPYTLSIQ